MQSRLVDNSRPLHDLYNTLHSLCQSLQLEVLYSQTTKLIFDRLGDYIRIEEYKPGKPWVVENKWLERQWQYTLRGHSDLLSDILLLSSKAIVWQSATGANFWIAATLETARILSRNWVTGFPYGQTQTKRQAHWKVRSCLKITKIYLIQILPKG